MTTTLVSELPVTTPQTDEYILPNGLSELEEAIFNDSSLPESENEELQCAVCFQLFQARDELDEHIQTHLKQPKIILERVEVPEDSEDTEEEEISSFDEDHIRPYKNLISQVIEQVRPEGSDLSLPLVPKLRILLPQQLSDQVDKENNKNKLENLHRIDEVRNEAIENLNKITELSSNQNMVELQTLPNESQSPSFPGQSPGQPDVSMHQSSDNSNFWSQDEPHNNDNHLQSLHQESGEKEAERHDSLLQNFLNDSAENVSSKDHGMIIPSHETEFISLDRLAGPQCSVCGERYVDQAAFDMHCKATGHYPSNSLVPYGQPGLGLERQSGHGSDRQLSTQHSNPLDSLTNLPMQQLAQQVNRLQQGQVHQQNVLINIQQFGQPMAPPPPPYGGADMSHMHHMPHYGPSQPQQPPPHHMYMPHYGPNHPPAPPHHMYYPGGGPGMYGPPPPHVQQQQQQQQQQPPPPPQQPPPQPHPGPPPQQPRPQYHREPSSMMPPRMPPPQRMPPQQMRGPQVRGQALLRGTPTGLIRGRGPSNPMQRVPQPHMGGRGATNIQQQRIILQKRNANQEQQQQQMKKKRLDVLIPDTNDNDDCHVISMQKCNDGLPIIKNVQGAATTAAEGLDPVVHLTDSITLSVRNPKEAPPVTQQKKNDAKAVANILATRGITVTPATKSQKEAAATVTSKASPTPVAINLNSAVSIIPTARNQQGNKASNGASSEKAQPKPPTVDLTDDDPGPAKNNPQSGTPGKRALPHQCDLCPAQYPNMRTLVIHRRQYHKAGPQSELGVPIVDLSQPAVLSKLASLGIHSYIPLPQTGSGSNATFALPIVSVNAARNPNVCNISALGSGAVLTLGPLHHISNLPTKQ